MNTELLKLIVQKVKDIFKVVLKILETVVNFLLKYSKPILIVCIMLSTVFLIIKLVLEIKFIRVNRSYINRKVDLGTITYEKEEPIQEVETDEMENLF